MLILDGNSLTLDDVGRVAKREITDISLSETALERVRRSRQLVENWVERGEVIYGVTTGFGEFANVSISREKIELLQQNLIRSHAAGTGEPLPTEVVRAMLLLRANALSKGYSGVREAVIEQLLTFLKHDILPVILSKGSVGSSGDLAPLSHLALALTGEGKVSIPSGDSRKVVPASDALKTTKITPLQLGAKEGLALINGTQMMSALGSIALVKAKRLAEIADIAASMSFEALRATDTAYDDRISDARPHIGQRKVAENMRHLTEGSQIRNSHLENDPRVQDAYSLRCIPQVHGAVRDTISFVENVLTTEINSATDNPLIIPDEAGGAHLEGGNFHGEPLALALDYLAIATSELANISERRSERMVNGALSNGLPRFLTKQGGLNSGMMIAQYTAAALVSENKVLAHPASVDSITTSANQEDHNSMGSIAALKLQQVIDNVETVLAIEMLCAAQGIDFLSPLKPGNGSGAAYTAIRSIIPHLDGDRNISEDIAAAKLFIASDSFTVRTTN
ncbi:MAG TPA: histidine ammonia-lyase [Candidatus Kapabacteria bacterium]|nr:histidine ammonia-lyase [Candidatus Kapabacteria bacterium]